MVGDNSQLNVMSDASVIPPWGVAGAPEGGFNACGVIRNGEPIEPSNLPGKVRSFPLKHDDLVIMRATSGGGVGDPLDRDPELVLNDVLLEYVSVQRAHEVYGVVIDNGEINREATTALRSKLRKEKHRISIISADEDTFDAGGCRISTLSTDDARALGLKDGEMFEFVPTIGAPLRSWASVSNQARQGAVKLGPLGQAALRINGGEQIQVRRLKQAPPITHYNQRR